MSSDQNEAVNKAKKYAMEQSIRMVLMKQTIAYQQQVCIHVRFNVLKVFKFFIYFSTFLFQQEASQRTQIQRQQALALMCK